MCYELCNAMSQQPHVLVAVVVRGCLVQATPLRAVVPVLHCSWLCAPVLDVSFAWWELEVRKLTRTGATLPVQYPQVHLQVAAQLLKFDLQRLYLAS